MIGTSAPRAVMSLSAAVNVLRWLTWDTFRQALASRIFWVMLTLSAVAVLFCAGVGVRGGKLPHSDDEPPEFVPRGSGVDERRAQRDGVFEVQGELTLAFGAVAIPHARDAVDSVHHMH